MNDMSSRIAAFAVLAPARFSSDEFEQIMQAGLDLDIKLELAGGVLERMGPPSNEHSTGQTLVAYRLMSLLGANSLRLVRIELAVRLDAETVRVPDLCLLNRPTDATGTLPADAVELAIEIAEKTLAKDLGPKLEEYARAAIPNYWVVDPASGVTHVYFEPSEGTYRRKLVVRFNEPLTVPGVDGSITLA